MQPSSIRICIGALAYTAGLARGFVGLLVSGRTHAETLGDPVRLRKTIVGHSKKQVARLLGPPPAAGSLAPHGGTPEYLMANVWYYPFDPQTQTAVAVQFNHDRVVDVEVIGS